MIQILFFYLFIIQLLRADCPAGKFQKPETEEQTWRKVWQILPNRAEDFRAFVKNLDPLEDKERWRFAVSTFRPAFDITNDIDADDDEKGKAQMIYDEILVWTREQDDLVKQFLKRLDVCTDHLCRMIHFFKDLREYVLSDEESIEMAEDLQQKHSQLDSSFINKHAKILQLMIYDVDKKDVKDEEKMRRQERMQRLDALLKEQERREKEAEHKDEDDEVNELDEVTQRVSCDLLDAMMCSLFTQAEKVLTTILGGARYHQMYRELVETYKTSKSTPQKVLKRFGEDIPGYQLQDYTNSFTNLVYVLDQVKATFGSVDKMDQSFGPKQKELVQAQRQRAQQRKDHIKCDLLQTADCFVFSRTEKELMEILEEEEYDELFWILVRDVESPEKPFFRLADIEHETPEGKKRFDRLVKALLDILEKVKRKAADRLDETMHDFKDEL